MRSPAAGAIPLRRLLAREDGQAMVFVAVAFAAILGFVGLAIDGSRAFVNHKQMQTAADAAALAGAYDVVHGNPASVGDDVNTYAHNNGLPSSITLGTCASSSDSNCYAYPYVDKNGHVHPSAVEVRIHTGVTPFFTAFVHIANINVKTRAVASLVAGQETPQYSFVALQSDGENHTLLVKNGSTLNVANSLYTDSCGGMPGCQGGGSDHDSFDVFGSGGTITDAKDIFVVGGWETHDGDFVGANGATCLVGAGPYSPSVKAAVALTGNPTPTTVFKIGGVPNGSAGPVIANDVIQIDNEQMLVQSVTGTGANVTLTVTRGYNGTDIAAHAVNAVINKDGVVAVAFNPSISTPAGGINATDTTFNTSVAPTAVDPGDVIQIANQDGSTPPEQMSVVSVGANSLTVVRGYNGTTATAHAGGVVIKELEAPTSVSAPSGTPQGGNCPIVGQPYLPDPFALFPALVPGTQAWGSLPTPVTKIQRNSSNVATVVTSAANGFSAGTQIAIIGVGSGFDGTWTVASILSPTSFTYTNTGPALPAITNKQMTAGVATLTTNAPATTLSTNESDVLVSSLDSIFNMNGKPLTGTGTVTSGGNTFATFSYQPTPFSMSVTGKKLQSGLATLTVNSTTNVVSGSTVTVAGVGAEFNGSQTVTVASPTMLTFADPGLTGTLGVTNRAISGGTNVTLTTPANSVLSGDPITVNTGDPRFDRSTTASANGGTTVKYTLPAAITTTITNAAAASGTVRLTASSVSNFESGDTVTLPAGLGLAYGSGSVTLTGVNSGALSYAAPVFNTMSWSRVNTTVTITTASAHGLKTGDTVNIAGFAGMQACLSVGPTSVTGTPSGTTFTYTVAGACAPPAGGNNSGRISLVTAASAVASGTVTLTATPTLSGSGTVTVPLVIAQTTVSPAGSAKVTDVPSTATPVSTFTVGGAAPWMPTSGLTQNPLGGPLGPSPYLVNTNMNLQPGTYYGGICLGSANGTDCVGANCAAGSGSSTTPYSPAVTSGTVDATQTNIPITWVSAPNGGTPDPVANGDTIQIESEQMTVTAVGPSTYTGAMMKTGNATLTVTRPVNGTTGAAHNKKAVTKVPPPPTPITVNMAQGEYIMAGGGFHVCGNVSLNAPNVLIYNTNDPSSQASTYGKVGQVEINTTGTVTLGPQTLDQDPLYAGFTIFEDRAQVVDPATFTPIAYGALQSLSAGISDSDTTFNVTGTSSTIYPGNVISIDSELMMVTAVVNGSGTTKVTVTRGYDGKTQASHSAGTAVMSVKYGGDTCDGKSKAALGGDHTVMDISFLSAGNPPGGFPLDNISGTIYQAGPRADFENAMFGDANLAVISSCIFIDGGAVPPGLPAADFAFNPQGGNNLAGVGEALSE